MLPALRQFLSTPLVVLSGGAVTPGSLLVGMAFLLGSILLARIVGASVRGVLARRGQPVGAQFAVSKMVRYTIIGQPMGVNCALLVTRLKTLKREVPKEVIDDFLELARDEKLTPDARNDAILAVARLRYEQKDFNGAFEAYNLVKLPALDPGRATLYLEEAWTRYNLGQIHAAMGILTTLDAPSFRDEFLPDKYLLRALIYRDLCHYLPAKRAAKELTRRFADSLEAIREREDLSKDPRLLRAASSHGGTKRARRFLEALELEGELLGRFAGTFGERMFSYVTRLYDLSRAEATRIYDERLKSSVRAEADRLLRASEQVRLMEYEVGLKLYERVKKGSRLVPLVEEPPLKAGQVAFRFREEYWNDELRDYRFSLKSRCIEETGQ